MIKFFRHIRYTLMNENRTGKYFKYAIGEIILVVIGILIALQINNWNEIKKAHFKETILTKQLLEDLKQTYTDLETIQAFFLDRANAAEIISHSFWTGKHLKDTMLYTFSKTLSYQSYSPVLGTAKSLINSSNIDLMTSDDLKKAIINYVDETEASLTDIKRFEETYYRTGVLELLAEFDFHNLFATYLKDDYLSRTRRSIKAYPDEFENPPFPENIDSIYKNKKIYAANSKLIIAHRNTYGQYNSISEKTLTLINLIEIEGRL